MSRMDGKKTHKHTVTYELPITAVFYRGNFTEKSLYYYLILAEPYHGTAFSLGRSCTRAPDLAAQIRLENKQAINRLLSPLKYQRG